MELNTTSFVPLVSTLNICHHMHNSLLLFILPLSVAEMSYPHQALPKLQIREQNKYCYSFNPLNFRVICYIIESEIDFGIYLAK